MRIKQLYCKFGHGFAESMAGKYDLGPYVSTKDPLLMFGCYNSDQIRVALKHEGFVVICWRGYDALLLRKRGRDHSFVQGLKRDNIKHIVGSNFIAEDLNSLGISYRMLPITSKKIENIIIVPRGDYIYMYEPKNKTYGPELYNEVKAQLSDFRFIECTHETFDRQRIFNVYANCFVGLRFTEHDGLSNTACELGLMGRRIIWNGNTPNAIPYNKKDVEGIVRLIKNEYLRRHESDYVDIAKQTFDFLNIGEDFLETSWYKEQ